MPRTFICMPRDIKDQTKLSGWFIRVDVGEAEEDFIDVDTLDDTL